MKIRCIPLLVLLISTVFFLKSSTIAASNSTLNPHPAVPDQTNMVQFSTSVFSIDYPAEWYVDSIEDDGIILATFTPNALSLSADDLFIIESATLIEALRNQPIVAVAAIDRTNFGGMDLPPIELMNNFMGSLDIELVENQGDVVINGVNGVEGVGLINGQGDLDGLVLGTHTTILTQDDWVVIVAGVAAADVFNGYRDLFSAMMQSIQIAPTGWYSLYFTEPLNTNDTSQHIGAAVESAIIQSINNAQVSIDAALFELNLESVVQALIDARNRGIQVRLVLDDDSGVFDEDDNGEPVKSESINMFENAGWVVYCESETPNAYDIRCDDRGALMHHAYFIIDGSVVWTGSMEYTHNGIYNNNNNAIMIRSLLAAANYQAEFDEMFTDGIFTRSADQDNTPNRQFMINDVPIETYFSPEDGSVIENRIVDLIGNAETSVSFMAFSFTLDSIGEALVERFNSGVDVRGVVERRGSTTTFSEMVRLACADVPVRQDGNPNTLHHKVIVIDNEIVITGSVNFSDSAVSDNNENMLIIHSPQVAAQYTAEFMRHYEDPRATTPRPDEFTCE